jgi:undecaprenyl pyrophosphate phosphatase UppP
MGDLLFELSQWLYTTPLNAFAQGIAESRLSEIVVSWFWTIPLLQSVHILAIAATLVAVLMLNLRALGIAGHATLQETAQRYSKVLWWALVFVAITGVGMLFGDTVRNLLNSVFWIKMALLIVGLAMALGYSRSLARQSVGGGQVASAATKTTGIVLIAMWCMIILAGRWIAYAPS